MKLERIKLPKQKSQTHIPFQIIAKNESIKQKNRIITQYNRNDQQILVHEI